MTRIITIDCIKWQNVIKIILWSGITIGLGFLTQAGYNGFLDNTPTNCSNGDLYNSQFYCDTKKPSNILYPLGALYLFQGLSLSLAIIPSTINALFIWRFINSKLKLFEVRCKEDES